LLLLFASRGLVDFSSLWLSERAEVETADSSAAGISSRLRRPPADFDNGQPPPAPVVSFSASGWLLLLPPPALRQVRRVGGTSPLSTNSRPFRPIFSTFSSIVKYPAMFKGRAFIIFLTFFNRKKLRISGMTKIRAIHRLTENRRSLNSFFKKKPSS
jgi:hypothetical protein